MELKPVVETYALARPDLERADIELVVDLALERARAKHADFDRFLPGIEFLATVFFTDHSTMPIDDYLETLYCGVKHADFARAWRAQLKQPGRPVSPLVSTSIQ